MNFPFQRPTRDGLFAARCALRHDDHPGALFVTDVYVPAGPNQRERAWTAAAITVELALTRLAHLQEE